MVNLRTLGELRLEEAAGSALSSRRKELVFLAYLARRGSRPLARAEAAALLWPDRDERRARQSLRQALLELRQLVGDGLLVDGDFIQLDPGSVQLDAATFERELDQGRLADAVSRWGGDFLPGAEEIGAEDLRGWLEAERERLRTRLALALAQLVDEAQRNAALAAGDRLGQAMDRRPAAGSAGPPAIAAAASSSGPRRRSPLPLRRPPDPAARTRDRSDSGAGATRTAARARGGSLPPLGCSVLRAAHARLGGPRPRDE